MRRVKTVAMAVACTAALLHACVLGGCSCETTGRGGLETVSLDLERFNAAGPIEPKIDYSRIELAAKPTGAYRVVSGDVLDFEMPRVIGTVKEDLVQSVERRGRHLTRVDRVGRVILPLLGYVDVQGLTLQEVEERLIGLYHPRLFKEPPAIVAKVDAYHTEPVTVLGGVKTPGTYELRGHEMSLVTLLSRAGGIQESGAKAIRIKRTQPLPPRGAEATEPAATERPAKVVAQDTGDGKLILLPVEGLDIDFVDVALSAGDVIEVERLEPRRIAVVGLVDKPGVFTYPPRTQYTVFDAIALAGGLNTSADPKWATVYRMDSEGKLVGARFRLSRFGTATEGVALPLKPGDVVAVEHTVATNIRTLMVELVRIGFGFGGNVVFF